MSAELGFELFKEALTLSVILFGEGVLKLLEQILLFFAEVLGNFNINLYILVAALCTVGLLDALALEAENGSGLCALAESVLLIAVDSRDSDLSAENGFCISNGNIAVYIIALSSEHRVGLYENVYEEIAGRTAVDTAVAHTAASESLSVSNTSRHVDIYSFLNS